MFKKILLDEIEIIQTNILLNFGNTAYQKISKDYYFQKVPLELFEIWYSNSKFSFGKINNTKELKELNWNGLLRYYLNIFIIFIKLNKIFYENKRRS